MPMAIQPVAPTLIREAEKGRRQGHREGKQVADEGEPDGVLAALQEARARNPARGQHRERDGRRQRRQDGEVEGEEVGRELVDPGVDHQRHDGDEHHHVGDRGRQLHAEQDGDHGGDEQDRNELDADHPDDGLTQLRGEIRGQRHLRQDAPPGPG